jgi:hypothetical protein
MIPESFGGGAEVRGGGGLVLQNTPTPQSDTFKQPKKVSDSSPRAGDPATTEYPGQIQDFITETETEIKKGGRVIATTLTKKMAEDLSEYYGKMALGQLR